jgi:D-alanyl-D-alanine carboxypeptidase/D-alanyl-D-alanine-endopeptidase (penicillin-binding protein 4)
MIDSFYGSLPRKLRSSPPASAARPRLVPSATRRGACRSPLRKALLTALCACLPALGGACLAPAAASAASETAALQADLSHQMAIAGSHSGAYVYDLTANQALFTERAETLRPPASVEKLYTATSALELLGPTARLTTNVLGSGHLAAGGIWEGNLYLRGGGDPTFGTSSFIHSHYGGQGASVSTLVTQLVRTDDIHHITGSIEGDETYFDSLRGEPSSNFGPDPFLEGTLSGLSFNRGAVGSERGSHAPAAYAAHQLLAALKSDGVTVGGSFGAATTPASATTQLAAVQSPTVNGLLALTLPPSDNFFAETLVKDLGARFGGAGTTSAGANVVSQTIAKQFGFTPRVLDGSGLSESDRTSPYEVADLLVELAPTSIGAVLRSELAVAGSTGTLSERMRHTGAAGRCQGKTGTLTGVSNLVGYCQARDGHLLAFAWFTDGISTSYAHTIQDHMTISVADF